MNFFTWLKQSSLYLWEGIIRIFSPKDDNYPESGVQPFEGDVYEENDGYV